jgi:dTMP kinase
MIDPNKPKFITFEGGEGSGKSTQSKMLHEYLLNQGIKAIHTREVGGTLEAEKIRDVLVYSDLMPVSELMLVMAARYEHINKVIIPALNDGTWVICDRFIDSTACYQSGKDSVLTIEMIFKLHKELIKDVHDRKSSGLMPHLTFFMDVPPAIGLKRAGIRGDVNKFEEKNITFHEEIYARFKQIAASDPARFKVIDATDRTIDEIHGEVIKKL